MYSIFYENPHHYSGTMRTRADNIKTYLR